VLSENSVEQKCTGQTSRQGHYTHTFTRSQGLSPDLVCVNILLSKGPLQHERLPVVVIVVILFVCAWSGLLLRGQSARSSPLSPAFVLHSASKVLYPALALAHTHTLNRIRHLLQLPLPFGLAKFKRGCKVEDGDSQHGKLLKIYEAFGPLLHSSNYRHAYFILGLH